MSELGMKFVGKDPNGTARAIKVDNSGRLFMSGESEVVQFSKANKIPPRNADADYEPREAGYSKIFYLPQLVTPYAAEGFAKGASRNIFDQMIVIYSSVNIAFSVGIGPTYTSDDSFGVPLYGYTIGEIPAASATNKPQRMILIPEKSAYPMSGYNVVYEVAELRQPVPSFRLAIFATDNAAIPTQGELKIMCVRRY